MLLAVVLCLSLTACGYYNNDYDDDYPIEGADWRTWGIVRDYGTITRYGEDTVVLVCVYTEDATFYYDTEDQTVFDLVYYPPALNEKVALSGDVWGMFKGIDFADLDGDGNSDVTMRFDDSGSELLVVWFWDAESSEFVYQPDESQLGENSGVPELNEDDYSMYEGIWLNDANDQYDSIGIDAKGNWQLYSSGDVIEEGYLKYEPEEDVTYVCTYQGSDIDDGYVDLDGDQLYISTLGSFHYFGHSVSAFQGIWYLDEDLSAETYIEIDSNGYWYYYQRTPGDAEAAEIDCGTFTYALDEFDIPGTYYANSMYDSTSYLVFNFDEGILIWGDEGAYYWMDNWD